jgi:hypothetical protein
MRGNFGIIQGDQIGRMFAYWVVIFLGSFLKNTDGFRGFYFLGTSFESILTKNQLRDFLQTHLVTLVQSDVAT